MTGPDDRDPAAPEGRVHSLVRCAELLGVKHGTLKRWVHEGMPGVIRGENGWATGLDLTEAGPWLAEKRRSGCAFGRKSAVYFARCRSTGEIKIGMSSDLKPRLKRLQSKEHRRVEILGTLPGDKTTELYLHRLFAAARIEGEWFHPTADLLALIALLTRTEAA
jgi:hypothetical protein